MQGQISTLQRARAWCIFDEQKALLNEESAKMQQDANEINDLSEKMQEKENDIKKLQEELTELRSSFTELQQSYDNNKQKAKEFSDRGKIKQNKLIDAEYNVRDIEREKNYIEKSLQLFNNITGNDDNK